MADVTARVAKRRQRDRKSFIVMSGVAVECVFGGIGGIEVEE